MSPTIQGTCRKMPARLIADNAQSVDFSACVTDAVEGTTAVSPPSQARICACEVDYQLQLGDDACDVSTLVGKTISLQWLGNIYCVSCGRKTSKSYAQGHCYPCFKNSASCDLCIMQPERCHYHLGTCREPDWAQGMCFKEHIVYLSYTSGVKVGITRQSQVPTRWIDQGAVAAVPIFTTSSRRLAGVVEQFFKDYLADKTDWRKMLKGDFSTESIAPALTLSQVRDDLFNNHLLALKDSIDGRDMITTDSYDILYDAVALTLQYPVHTYPEKVKSRNFEKTPEVSGTVLGVKGQYLILDTGVLNIRKFSGYELSLTIAE